MDQNTIVAALLGLLEGLTEFIPVSSTGHVLLAGHFLGFDSPGRAFEVLIQLGALLAIISVYFKRLWTLATRWPFDVEARRFLIGLIVASIVNIFLQSSGMQFAISVLGVLIFAGLTAYDTQNIKNTYLQMAGSDRDFLGKTAIMGALQLYLDFLNLFMFLLQFLGNRE